MDTITHLSELVSDVAEVPLAKVTPQSTPRELHVDSLALVDLAMRAQSAFGVPLEDGDLRPHHTVGDMAALIDTKLASAAQ